ncbi:MAG: TerD family protein [Planctomycetota bacterium]|nr:TerD family protein [Planctomycetota bacterium]
MVDGDSRSRRRPGFWERIRERLRAGGKEPAEPVRARRKAPPSQPSDPWRKYTDRLSRAEERAWRGDEILLRRRSRIRVAPGSGEVPEPLLATFLENLASVGYAATPALIERLATQSTEDLTVLHHRLLGTLQKAVGADREFRPMYPGFPDQVMEADEAELYINAWLHYAGDVLGVRIMPDYPDEVRAPLDEDTQVRPLDLGTDEDLLAIGTQLIGANASLSETDKADVAWFVQRHHEDLDALLPADIPYRENLALVAALLLDHPKRTKTVLSDRIRSATDVLRIAAALSGGDVSLAQATPFRSLPRRQRRELLGLLEGCRKLDEDFARHRERWKRLGERLHPGEYRQRFPQAAAAFDRIRAGERRAPGFDAQVEAALECGDATAALELLRTRPGALARRLDHLLRLGGEPDAVLEAFEAAAPHVAVPVLLQVRAHFLHRPSLGEIRAFFPKGNVARVMSVPNELPPLSTAVCDRVADICRSALKAEFAKLPALGATYVDPALRDYLVPFSQRSASRALRTIVRGSRVPLPKGDTIRFFLWWREGLTEKGHTGRVDIDLSAVFLDALWDYGGHVSYTRLRLEACRAVHSGDITSAPEGACEFIDVDVPSFTRHGFRYVVMNVNSFTGQRFADLPECFAGWMVRKKPGSGEVFEPTTVVDRLDLAGEKRISIPCILDLVKRQLIWADIQLSRNPHWVTNVEANRKSMGEVCRAIATLPKPTLHDLFVLHAEARGTLVDTPEEAETEFSVAQGTPFALETITAEYLGAR